MAVAGSGAGFYRVPSWGVIRIGLGELLGLHFCGFIGPIGRWDY